MSKNRSSESRALTVRIRDSEKKLMNRLQGQNQNLGRWGDPVEISRVEGGAELKIVTS